jgi:hypothetical protein
MLRIGQPGTRQQRLGAAARSVPGTVSSDRHHKRDDDRRDRRPAPIRPTASAARLDTLTPAFELAIVELTIARKTKNQKIP